jgi:mRNA interferase MazF
MESLKRGDLWSIATRGLYSSKPRPALIVQADAFGDLSTVTICMLTSADNNAWIFRPMLEPTQENGLLRTSFVMTDKIASVPKLGFGAKIGRLDQAEMARVEQSMAVFLGFTN